MLYLFCYFETNGTLNCHETGQTIEAFEEKKRLDIGAYSSSSSEDEGKDEALEQSSAKSPDEENEEEKTNKEMDSQTTEAAENSNEMETNQN